MKYKIHFMHINFNICMVNVKTLKYIVFNLRYDLFPWFSLVLVLREQDNFIRLPPYIILFSQTSTAHTHESVHTHNAVKNTKNKIKIEIWCVKHPIPLSSWILSQHKVRPIPRQCSKRVAPPAINEWTFCLFLVRQIYYINKILNSNTLFKIRKRSAWPFHIIRRIFPCVCMCVCILKR